MSRIKKFIFIFPVVLALFFSAGNTAVLRCSAFSVDFDIASEAAFLVNLDTDITVFRKNEFMPVYPASTTKIMTALVVLDNIANLNEFVRVTDTMNHNFGINYNFQGAGVADFEVGQSNLTYLDCLYALMLHSACDAANILAHNVGLLNGGEGYSTFIQMMNAKATELGCVNTNFANPHGLHQKNNYTTAYDMFLITKYVWEKYDVFREIVAEPSYHFPANSRYPTGITLRNTNRLIQNTGENLHFYEFALGVKTGSINRYLDVDTGEFSPGNFNLVSVASRSGYTYLLVTLGAPFHQADGVTRSFVVYDDHLSLFRWAFSSLEYRAVLSVNDILRQVTVLNGQDADRVQLQPAHDFNYLLPSDLDRSAILREVTLFDEEVEAPVARGEILGFVELKLADEVLAKIDLVAAADVEKSFEARVVRSVTGIFSATWFQALAAVVVALALFVVALRIMNSRRRKARKNGGRPRW
jgi:D-alanyl-D-alanine carboxypeptidase (penicillin-binding protein 5/6)